MRGGVKFGHLKDTETPDFFSKGLMIVHEIKQKINNIFNVRFFNIYFKNKSTQQIEKIFFVHLYMYDVLIKFLLECAY